MSDPTTPASGQEKESIEDILKTIRHVMQSDTPAANNPASDQNVFVLASDQIVKPGKDLPPSPLTAPQAAVEPTPEPTPEPTSEPTPAGIPEFSDTSAAPPEPATEQPSAAMDSAVAGAPSVAAAPADQLLQTLDQLLSTPVPHEAIAATTTPAESAPQPTPATSQTPAPEASADKPAPWIAPTVLEATQQKIQHAIHRLDQEAWAVRFRSGLTMEDIVIEALKPQLSAWLDQHLEALVSEILERELGRVLPPKGEKI